MNFELQQLEAPNRLEYRSEMVSGRVIRQTENKQANPDATFCSMNLWSAEWKICVAHQLLHQLTKFHLIIWTHFHPSYKQNEKYEENNIYVQQRSVKGPLSRHSSFFSSK